MDKRWILWVVYFLIELTLLGLAVYGDTPDELPSLQDWRRQSVFAAVASMGAVILGLITWRMRWSMRPRLLRVIMVILMGVGVAVAALEWHRVYNTSGLIVEEQRWIEAQKKRQAQPQRVPAAV